MVLSGDRKEKICSQHFVTSDFIENTRWKLRKTAVPSVKLEHSVKYGGSCCVTKCKPSKRKTSLHRFPTGKQIRRRWKIALGLKEADDTTGLLICNRHFMLSDFVKVTSRYLKATAVPSKKISRIIKLPRRDLKKLNLPIHLEDHNYSEYACPPRSNRICYVEGCRSKTEGDIKLHKFPGRKDVRFKEWIRVLKCSKLPTANSKVCSLHFSKSNYFPGGSRLKRDAIPSLNFSNTTTGSDSTSSSEASPTHGSTYCHEEDQAKKNTSSDRISENQSTHVPVFVMDSCEDHNDGEIGGNRSNDFAVGQSFQESQILNDTLLLDTSQLSINTPIAESTAKKHLRKKIVCRIQLRQASNLQYLQYLTHK
ncbi:uncharacterized protein LOC134210247 [Armigeres subalbatus]|uniref:uncharacterized protein LOC134210247 n=1 Tax=Armigeres subalbatus TaxID=124917 RepID=UPI002ED434E0